MMGKQLGAYHPRKPIELDVPGGSYMGSAEPCNVLELRLPSTLSGFGEAFACSG